MRKHFPTIEASKKVACIKVETVLCPCSSFDRHNVEKGFPYWAGKLEDINPEDLSTLSAFFCKRRTDMSSLFPLIYPKFKGEKLYKEKRWANFQKRTVFNIHCC